MFDSAAVQAQLQLPHIQGQQGVWFCGAWTRYGFHEDGLMSAQAVVQELGPLLRNPEAAAHLLQAA